jgi:hypothetical protein
MERFWKKTVLGRNGCIEWTAAKKDGYGVFQRGAGDGTILAHRYAYMMANGMSELSRDDIIMHICDNPACVNIEHLRRGTHADNVADKVAKGRGINGSRHYMSRLTDENVRFIRSTSIKSKDLATLFNVSRPTISDIRRGKTWLHIK